MSRAGNTCWFSIPWTGPPNIEINGPVGTIFSILRSPDPTRLATKEDFLQPGRNQIAAGYVLYSASTTMLLTLEGKGVAKFILDPGVGEFVLVERNVQVPGESQGIRHQCLQSAVLGAPRQPLYRGMPGGQIRAARP